MPKVGNSTLDTDIHDLLDDYADIRDELEDAMLSFQYLQSEIECALEDITDELDTLQGHLEVCGKRLRRFHAPTHGHWEVNHEP